MIAASESLDTDLGRLSRHQYHHLTPSRQIFRGDLVEFDDSEEAVPNSEGQPKILVQ